MLVLFFSTNSYATGMAKISLDQVVQKADIAFEGKCESRKPFKKKIEGYKSEIIVSEYKFTVIKWIKPKDYTQDELTKKNSKTFEFIQRGVALADSRKVGLTGASRYPSYDVNKDYILFLKKMPDGLLLPVATLMGSNLVEQDANGNKVVKNAYMKNIIKSSKTSAIKAMSADVTSNSNMNYDSFMKAVEDVNK